MFIFIPGRAIAAITFPGVIVHEMAHQFFCRMTRTAILDVCYFRIGNPAGYVTHEIPLWSSQHLLIAIAPFLVNTVVGALIAFPAAIPVITFRSGSIFNCVLIWVGVSVAMHAFPSTGDAESIWHAIWEPGTNLFVRIVALPIVVVIYLCSFGSMVWLDAIYGVLVTLALPTLIVRLLA